MALLAVVSKCGMTARNLSRIEKCFRPTALKKPNARDSGNNREEADPKTRSPKWMLSMVVAEIAFVALGNLFLRSAGRSHGRRLVIKQCHECMPSGEHEQQKRKRHVHEQPGMQPMVQFRLEIEHAAFGAP